MRSLYLLGAAFLVAGAAAMGPSLADAQGQSKGKGKGQASSVQNMLNSQLAHPAGATHGTAGAANLLSVGQHLPAGFNNFTSLSSLPAPVRGLLPQGMNYVLQGNSVAAVDPTSRIVRQVIPIPH